MSAARCNHFRADRRERQAGLSHLLRLVTGGLLIAHRIGVAKSKSRGGMFGDVEQETCGRPRPFY